VSALNAGKENAAGYSSAVVQLQNNLRTKESKGLWPEQCNDWTGGCHMVTHLLRHTIFFLSFFY
jgi:hypothetical protein